jgi:serine protease Do
MSRSSSPPSPINLTLDRRSPFIRRIRAAAMIAAIAAALTLAAACNGSSDNSTATVTPGAATTATPGQGGGSANPPSIQSEGGLTTVQIVEKLAPSIVRVQTEGATIDQFGRVAPSTGVGTGVIIDRDGHIVTNNHVVTGGTGDQPSDKITVTLSDQTTAPATIVGRDVATDLAVLKIDAPKLTPAAWGNADELQVGQEVVAIGYALGLEGAPSVTRGVISATNRTIDEQPYTIPDAVQTDAGINPGNSGGPLVNARGEVIGINTAIIQNAQNIGFSISVGLAKPIVEQLISQGSITRAYVGIGSVDVNAAIAQNFNLPVDHGIVVTLVANGSPAQEAGLQRNDVITAIDGQSIDNNGELLSVLAQKQPGDTVKLTYYRDGGQQEADLTLAQRPPQ